MGEVVVFSLVRIMARGVCSVERATNWLSAPPHRVMGEQMLPKAVRTRRRFERLWSPAWLLLVVFAKPCFGQVTFCAVDRTLVEQSAEWCQKRNAPYVTIATPGKLTEIEAVKLLQLQLSALGFDPAGIDGLVGPGTSNAIRQFQKSTGQNVDGQISAQLRMQLDDRTRSKPMVPSDLKPEPPPNSAGVNKAAGPPIPDGLGQATSKQADSSDSPFGAIAFVLAVLAGAFWLLFRAVRFLASLPRRRELSARVRSITTEEEAASVIGQMTERDLALSTSARRDCFGRFFENALAGDTITAERSQHLKQIQQVLRLGENDVIAYAARMARAEALGRIDAGILPEVTNPPVNLQFGEKACFAVGAQLLEERVVGRRYQGGSRGVSIRIMKGVSYRFGASRGTSVSVRGVVPVSSGCFCITSQRLIFSGSAKSFAVDRKKILSTQVHSDGITVSPESGPTRTIQFTQPADPYVVQRLVNWVINPMRIEAR